MKLTTRPRKMGGCIEISIVTSTHPFFPFQYFDEN